MRIRSFDDRYSRSPYRYFRISVKLGLQWSLEGRRSKQISAGRHFGFVCCARSRTHLDRKWIQWLAFLQASAEKVPHGIRDFPGMGLQREVPGVEQMDFSIQDIVFEIESPDGLSSANNDVVSRLHCSLLDECGRRTSAGRGFVSFVFRHRLIRRT